MGDRGNIIIRQEQGTSRGDVWFYTHWSGSEMPAVVQRALKRRQRWDDPLYLARIVFSELVGKEQWDSETGFGISTGIGDNEHHLLVVDVPAKKVAIIESEVSPMPDGYACAKSWTFDEFAALKEEELPEV